MRTRTRSQLLSSATKLIAACLGLLHAGCDLSDLPEHTSEPLTYLYVYGEKVGFGLGGDSHRFKLTGWSQTEQGFTWTDGIGASLIFRVAPTTGPLTLRMRLAPFTKPPGLMFQPVEVSANGRRIASWRVLQGREYKAVVAADLVNAIVSDAERAHLGFGRRRTVRDSSLLIIDLYIPRAYPPLLLDDVPDLRRLGVQCSELVLTEGADPHADDDDIGGNAPKTPEGSPYAYGTEVKFGAGENAGRYKLDGWHDAESAFTWTSNVPARLGFRLTAGAVQRPLILKMNIHGNTYPPKLFAQPTAVIANGKKVADWNVTGRDDFSAFIPADTILPSGILTIELHSPDAASPMQLGVNQDARPLGIACHNLTIEPAK